MSAQRGSGKISARRRLDRLHAAAGGNPQRRRRLAPQEFLGLGDRIQWRWLVNRQPELSQPIGNDPRLSLLMRPGVGVVRAGSEKAGVHSHGLRCMASCCAIWQAKVARSIQLSRSSFFSHIWRRRPRSVGCVSTSLRQRASARRSAVFMAFPMAAGCRRRRAVARPWRCGCGGRGCAGQSAGGR